MNLFLKSQKWTFWKYIFFFAFWFQGKKYPTIIIAATVDSYNLKAQRVDVQQVSLATDAAQTLMKTLLL